MDNIRIAEKVYNENETTVRNNFKYFGGISIIYGIIFAFCMYRNVFGAAFLLYAVSTVAVIWMFIEKTGNRVCKETKVYFTVVLLLGISTCITASKFIQFLNWAAVIGCLLMAMLSQFFEKRKWNVLFYFGNLTTLFFTTIGFSFLSIGEANRQLKFRRGSDRKSDEKKEIYRRIGLILIGIAGAVGVLIFVFPLLLSSDMIFRQLFGDIFFGFHFEWMIPDIWSWIEIAVLTVAGFCLIYAFFYASCHVKFELEPERKMKYFSPITGITFAAVIAFVYMIYSGIQIIYLFLGRGLPAGITYSEYARAGFWQLLLVAFINVCMVMVCTYLFENKMILKLILTIISACTYVMIISAAYRMYLYVSVYNLTFLRLTVFVTLAVLALIMCGVVVTIFEKDFNFVNYSAAVVIGGYVLFSFSQPDYWIAKYNVSHTEQIKRSDINYLMYGLSLDAAPVIAEINPDRVLDYYVDDIHDYAGEETIEMQFENYFRTISENQENLSLRKANFSRLRAKKIADQYLE